MSHKTIQKISRSITSDLRKICPNFPVSNKKIVEIICANLKTNPADINLFLKLHQNYEEEYGCAAVICTFYNHREDKSLVDAAIYQQGNEKYGKQEIKYLWCLKDIPTLFTDKNSGKEISKLKRFAEKAIDAKLYFLDSEATTLKDAETYTKNITKSNPPHHHTNISFVSFSEQRKDDDTDSFNANNCGMIPRTTSELGIIIVHHGYPYLPVEISYYIGNITNKTSPFDPEYNHAISYAFSYFRGRYEEGSEIYIGVKEISCHSFFNNKANKQYSLPLQYVNFFRQHSFELDQPIFDLLNDAFEHKYEQIAKSFNLDKDSKLQPLIPKCYDSYSPSGEQYEYFDEKVNPQHLIMIGKGHIFGSDFFQIKTVKRNEDFSMPVFGRIDKSIKDKNILDRVKNLRDLLDVDKITR